MFLLETLTPTRTSKINCGKKEFRADRNKMWSFTASSFQQEADFMIMEHLRTKTWQLTGGVSWKVAVIFSLHADESLF